MAEYGMVFPRLEEGKHFLHKKDLDWLQRMKMRKKKANCSLKENSYGCIPQEKTLFFQTFVCFEERVF
jgi:hypothetical protein